MGCKYIGKKSTIKRNVDLITAFGAALMANRFNRNIMGCKSI